MRILIADDDFASRLGLVNYLKEYGECDVTVDGSEAVEAFTMAINDDKEYSLVCLDADMPILDGYSAYEKIREIETARGKKNNTSIIITTAFEKEFLSKFEKDDIIYLPKPINQEELKNALCKAGLV